MGRLYNGNLEQLYPERGMLLHCRSIPMEGYLQKDYGDDLDCTITSLATIFGIRHYETIEKIALRHGYNGKRGGTNPLTVRRIMQDTMATLGLKGKCLSAYGKGVGYNYKKVQELINRGHPIVLNMAGDGRGYYRNHSVLIVGYREFKQLQLLEVLDNWNRTVSFIDYRKLSAISSINWYE